MSLKEKNVKMDVVPVETMQVYVTKAPDSSQNSFPATPAAGWALASAICSSPKGAKVEARQLKPRLLPPKN